MSAGRDLLRLLGEAPFLDRLEAAAISGWSRGAVYAAFAALEGAGLVAPLPHASELIAPTQRYHLTAAGLHRLAAAGLARRRWSARLVDPQAPPTWRNVSGRRSRQLLRTLAHTTAVHGFAAMLAGQARRCGWEVAQIDPPHRASRYFRDGGAVHSVHPDAFAVLRRDGQRRPFFLEWERRAVRPSTMAARLAPYLRYYATQRPADDHGLRPAVLVVFEDELAAHHFLRVARAELRGARVELPLWVSHRRLLEREGPLGEAWTAPHASEAPWLPAPVEVQA